MRVQGPGQGGRKTWPGREEHQPRAAPSTVSSGAFYFLLSDTHVQFAPVPSMVVSDV